MRASPVILLISFLALAFSLELAGRDQAPPTNYGVVVAGRIYRGAQPSSDDLDFLKNAGIKTVLKLNSGGAADEKRRTSQRGLKFIHIPTEPDEIGQSQTCLEVRKALEGAGRKLLTDGEVR